MYEDFRLEDVGDDLVAVAHFMGIDLFVEFCEEFGGQCLYFPGKKSLLRPSRNREIRKLFDGYNYEDLARRFGISVTQVRNVVRGMFR